MISKFKKQFQHILEYDNSKVYKKVEEFVCLMSTKKSYESVDALRLDMFLQRFKPKRNAQTLSCVKCMDGSALPPCRSVLKMKFERMIYICNIWLNATLASPPNLLPEEYGFLLKENCYRIEWSICLLLL